MESEIVNYASKLSPIMDKLLEDAYWNNSAIDFMFAQSHVWKPEEFQLRLPEVGIAYFMEGMERIKARQKEIAEVVPPIEAKSHHMKLLMACQKGEQALGEYITYVSQVSEHGVGEDSYLQRWNALMQEKTRLLDEANRDLLELYTKAYGR